MVDAGVIKKNVAEVKTPDTVNEFKAGQVVFAINWGFAWDRFRDDKDSTVQGKVGVMPLPAMAGGKSATCVGGWQWAVSAFSKNKAEAAKLVKYMVEPPSRASSWPSRARCCRPIQSVYTDADVVRTALVQGRRQRRHCRQEPPDEQGLRSGQRRGPHDDQRGAGAHQEARPRA